MSSAETWGFIHAERQAMVETLSSLSAEQWAAPSWCEGWTVQDTAAHIVAAAEQTPSNFYKELIQAGFRFHVFTDRAAKRLSSAGPDELVRRLQARTSTTNHPPAPVMAMLGEIVVHGEDIGRPLGLRRRPPDAVLVALAGSWKKSNLLIGARRRIAGLRLHATDLDWEYGSGPELSGPMDSLILAMVGRRPAYADLTGDGVRILADRP